MHLAEAHRWSRDPVLRGRMARVGSTSAAGALTRSLPVQSRLLQVESAKGTLQMHTKTWCPRPDASMDGLTSSQKRSLPRDVQSVTCPGVIETTYGKGKVVYIPADISWAFFRYGHDFLGRIMELALRDAAAGPPPVEVEAPMAVQAMTHRQGNRLVVHLLNDVSSFGRSANVRGESMYIRREVLPIHDIRVTFRGRMYRRFRLVPGGNGLDATPTADGLTVTVPRLDIHAMVVAETGGAAPAP